MALWPTGANGPRVDPDPLIYRLNYVFDIYTHTRKACMLYTKIWGLEHGTYVSLDIVKLIPQRTSKDQNYLS